MDLRKAFSSFDADANSEPDLVKYFVGTSSVTELDMAAERCVVSGLKGVGKTAIFRKLAEFDRQDIGLIIDVCSEKYSLNLPNLSLRAMQFSYEFEYEIAIEFLSAIMDSPIKDKLPESILKKAKNVVATFLHDLKELGGRVVGVSILGCGLNLANKEKKVLTGLNGRENEIKAKQVLKEICETGLITFRLVIDDPEDVFFSDGRINPQLIGGLWLAIVRLNKISDNFRSFLLLKTHVYNMVYESTPDLDKYPLSHKKICWDEESFKVLIKRRMKHFLGIEEQNSDKELWGELAQKTLSENYDFIFKNLRNGPRELLTWINLALEFNDVQNGNKFLDKDSLEKTLGVLSSRALSNFGSSHGEQYPNIKNLVSVIFEGNTEEVYSKDEFAEHIRNLQENNTDFQALHKNHAYIQMTVAKKFAELLFHSGAINLVGKKEIYPYMCGYTNDTFNRIDKIRLTPLFKYAL